MEFGLWVLVVTSICSRFAQANLWITEPYESTQWIEGQKARVEWSSALADFNSLKYINVYLMGGSADNAGVAAIIAKELNPTTQSVEWLVPKGLAGLKPFVKIEGVPLINETPVIERFSHRFMVLGTDSLFTQPLVQQPTVDPQVLNKQNEEKVVKANQFTTITSVTGVTATTTSLTQPTSSVTVTSTSTSSTVTSVRTTTTTSHNSTSNLVNQASSLSEASLLQLMVMLFVSSILLALV